MKDAADEVRDGLPALLGIKDRNVFRVRRLMGSRSVQEQADFMTSLAKRFHEGARKTLGEQLSNRDHENIEQYLDTGPVLEPEPEIERIWELERLGLFRRAKKSDIRKAVIEHVQKIVGAETAYSKGSLRYFEKLVCGWIIRTEIDFGGRSFDVSYCHSIVSGNEDRLAEHISICQWLGIAGMPSWEYLSENDVASAASCVALCCGRFITASESLLEGLR